MHQKTQPQGPSGQSMPQQARTAQQGVQPEAPAHAAAGLRSPSMLLAMQRSLGNQAVQRSLARRHDQTALPAAPGRAQRQIIQRNGDLPKIDHLSATAQSLLAGVLEKTTIDSAVRQIYDNMWVYGLANWKYKATNANANGATYIAGTATEGMCESYREAFNAILAIYDELRKTHPTSAVKDGALVVEKGQALVNDRFMTKTGLTLMGATALKGNVYLQVDGKGEQQAAGLGTVNRFIFRGHWTLKVNGVEFDPIFSSINQDNVAQKFDASYEAGDLKALPNTSKPIATGEFGSTFILLSDKASFLSGKAALADYYTQNKANLDSLANDGDVTVSCFQNLCGGKQRVKIRLINGARQVLREHVSDRATFKEMLDTHGGGSAAQKKAFDVIAAVADAEA